MTKVCIIGGKLQGVEALYLAGKAGMETTLIDHRESPLGKNFCGRFLQQDVIEYSMNLVDTLVEADFVLPALENAEVLATLKSLAETYDINLVYDPHAYAISSSKKISDEKMAAAGLPCPRYYPEGDFPYIVKPSDMSGSEGVAKIHDADEMEAFLKDHSQGEWIAQEFLDGPSFSLEVIGTPGDYKTYHVTELFMDPAYDCKRVLSCPDFPKEAQAQMEQEIVALAELVQLHGIMDLEVIESNGTMKILEIDARIPSQTPITVYHATGWNFMEELAAKFGQTPVEGSTLLPKERYVSLEQILCDGDTVSVLGEHIMTRAEGLHHRFDFCGADEALTDYAEGKETWVATLICVADTKEELEAKRAAIPQKIGDLLGREIRWIDAFPAVL
ncbi:MAG: 3-methylornithine--L-lysine ligase PylC [Firmicutes bacterium]|nr:3-methylornithine--L-lysine ligase PylC [Bacillota bacterium]